MNLCEFKASLVFLVSSRTAQPRVQRESMSKKKKSLFLRKQKKKTLRPKKKMAMKKARKRHSTQAVSRKAREHSLTEGQHSTQDVSRLSGHASPETRAVAGNSKKHTRHSQVL